MLGFHRFLQFRFLHNYKMTGYSVFDMNRYGYVEIPIVGIEEHTVPLMT